MSRYCLLPEDRARQKRRSDRVVLFCLCLAGSTVFPGALCAQSLPPARLSSLLGPAINVWTVTLYKGGEITSEFSGGNSYWTASTSPDTSASVSGSASGSPSSVAGVAATAGISYDFLLSAPEYKSVGMTIKGDVEATVTGSAPGAVAGASSFIDYAGLTYSTCAAIPPDPSCSSSPSSLDSTFTLYPGRYSVDIGVSGDAEADDGNSSFSASVDPIIAISPEFLASNPGYSLTFSAGIQQPSTLGAIPEPSTWAMLVVGFAGLGFAGWRRGRGARRPLKGYSVAASTAFHLPLHARRIGSVSTRRASPTRLSGADLAFASSRRVSAPRRRGQAAGTGGPALRERR
jgi:PEP-CTERM motif